MIQMLTMAAQALAVAASVLCNLQGAGVELLPVPSAVLQPLVRSARIAAMITDSFCTGPSSVVAEVPATPKKGENSDPSQASAPNATRCCTEPVVESTYQPRISTSISKAQDVARSAGHWKRKLHT